MKFQPLKEPVRLVIYRDGTISLRNLVGRKWNRWRHGLREISERDFKRLFPEERMRGGSSWSFPIIAASREWTLRTRNGAW
jgi:hypothetical protein